MSRHDYDVSEAAADTLGKVLNEGDIDEASRAALSAMYRAFQTHASGALADPIADQEALDANSAAHVIDVLRQQSAERIGTHQERLWRLMADDLERRWPQGPRREA
jgi:hypothetical protein